MRTAARIGVVGAGWWVTENHLPLLEDRTEVEFAGVCRRNPEQLQRVKERFGFEFANADYQEMLEKASLDGVIVGSPHNVHHEHAKAALEKALPRLSRISRPLKRSIVGMVS